MRFTEGPPARGAARGETLPLARLALAQRAFDESATRRFPELFTLKRGKMLSSPHAYLRGSAPLFYEVLRLRPDLRAPLPGTGWIMGDAHLENFGAFRTDDGSVVFDLNDFDEAVPAAPWSDDLLRLCASCFLSASFAGQAGARVLALVERLLEAHARAACSAKAPRAPAPSRPIAFLLRRAEDRPKRRMLDARAPLSGKRRRFAIGDRFHALPKAVAREVPALLRAYAVALGDRAPSHFAQARIADLAQRIAGTGSLGVVRVAALLDVDKRFFLYDLKEARPAAPWRCLMEKPPAMAFPSDADRVVRGARALLGKPPRRLAAVRSGRLRLSFIARQFTPSEDKLDLTQVAPADMGATVDTLGHLLGRAHRRAALEVPRKPWADAERRGLLERAAELAAIVEGAYLASLFTG